MKKLLSFRLGAVLLSASLLLASCDDEDEGLLIQPHDQNKMMAIMHGMMDEMEAMTMNEDPDITFARMMIMHHQGAIDMSNEELSTGDDATTKAMAQKIKDEQQKEIAELQAFISSYQPDQPADNAFNMELMNSMEKSGKQSDLEVLTGDTDQDFSHLMIVHHQSAIENSRSVMEHGTSAEIKEMAHMMINAQMAEIKELQEWLLANKSY
ncbi:DUF305 domain-containing protein [Rufibacter immobilis]|uniref:DUF305 domain-containing protein n=1 Tax=Rufibacter immobilis TaxID=1348778 RepID=A0A3M9N342_9BACT|nr:DUF305 domain-containing protein [Rufibacter immobilis]RNI31815.1 DUF305 domain-containing protein [Rufibacter immobilis]